MDFVWFTFVPRKERRIRGGCLSKKQLASLVFVDGGGEDADDDGEDYEYKGDDNYDDDEEKYADDDNQMKMKMKMKMNIIHA